MKYLAAKDNLTGKLNSMVYSAPGAGKSQFLLQHPYPVVVDPGEQGYMTVIEMTNEPWYKEFGDVPVLQINSQDELEEIVYYPSDVMARLKEAVPKFKDYPYATFGFENMNLTQEAMLGEGSKTDPKTKKVTRKATGIMSLPHTREHSGTPAMKDFNVLQRATKGFFKGVRNMPYNTVMTVHAGLSETEASPKGIDVPASQKDYAGFPDMYGQMKYKSGGLADFYFYLKRVKRGGKLVYLAYTEPVGKFEGRSKIASKLPGEIDWTNKSLFKIVQDTLVNALEDK